MAFMAAPALFVDSPGAPPVEWRIAPGFTDYAEAVQQMESRASAIAAGEAGELIWLVEHAPLFTAGTSARSEDLLHAGEVPLIQSGRGGQITYHGPGQRVVYVMLDLGRRGRDVRRLVDGLEAWMIAALAGFGVAAATSPAGTGVWVGEPGAERKIGAIGIRVRRWVTMHGMAINVTTNLAHYDHIVPCGIRDRGVTRLADLVPGADMAAMDDALWHTASGFLARLGSPYQRQSALESDSE